MAVLIQLNYLQFLYAASMVATLASSLMHLSLLPLSKKIDANIFFVLRLIAWSIGISAYIFFVVFAIVKPEATTNPSAMIAVNASACVLFVLGGIHEFLTFLNKQGFYAQKVKKEEMNLAVD